MSMRVASPGHSRQPSESGEVLGVAHQKLVNLEAIPELSGDTDETIDTATPLFQSLISKPWIGFKKL